MNGKGSLLNDGFWVVCLQSVAAVGQLWGLRWLTSAFPPAEFGAASLLLSVVALISTGLAGPVMQTLLRFYPEYQMQGRGYWARRLSNTQLVQLVLVSSPIVALGFVGAYAKNWVSAPQMLLLLALALLEMWRMHSATLLSATRSQKMLGIGLILESWGRPLVAVLLSQPMGVAVDAVLAGYVLATLLSCSFMHMALPKDAQVKVDEQHLINWRKAYWHYALPLLPLGLLGWVSGVIDRFMIGGMLSAADVGIYVALYGLCSRPLLMFGNMLETTIRPAYQKAVIEKNLADGKAYLKKWIVLLVLGCGLGLLVVALAHTWLASLLLGEQYRFASHFAVWIVLGYSLLVLSHVFTRVCYANGQTKAVLIIETMGALVSAVAGFILISLLGLWGAVLAIPIYFGLQLLISLWWSWRWIFPKSISGHENN